ncbi:glycosyltransferase [Algibacter pectinivorans]|uniref:Glycosyltransferase involved in cell wall bisynthesis n=1 Tax=Algibacter pectinivorans TaxID=870482 RepID=A0A1I1Q6J2_9FLAO|nr:glycosyltransferase [Algibacter pectinivorans]SFD17665.1 Glycosyltransferase involved in cell wall bisynthesis [Algibacter pectinivorans]
MLSILIPVYNYSISSLVEDIHKQATNAKINFEIICIEDGSTKFVDINKAFVDSLDHTSIIYSNKNNGRTKSRQILSEHSNFNWLLFLDADVMPKSDKFIVKHLENINSNYEAIYGGFAYKNIKPQKNKTLRYNFGKNFEEVNAKKRNLNPYQIVISANFLIKKSIFSKINSQIKIKSYGLDVFFGGLLKEYKVNVLHINNEVYHFGIEDNKVYLNKVKEFISVLLKLYNDRMFFEHSNKLLSVFINLKKYKLNYFISLFYQMFNKVMERNLLGSKPNMFILQLYKLSYICYKDLDS